MRELGRPEGAECNRRRAMSDPARAGEGARQDHRPRAGECTAAGRECRAGGENRALRAEVSKQKGVVRELERELSEREELHTVRTKLTAEQALRKTAEVKLRTFNLEKARLVKQLRAAEADFETAEEALAKAQPAADLERELISMSERELELNCAAQVAAAHHSALAAIEAALDAELAKRSYFTPFQYVERARSRWVPSLPRTACRATLCRTLVILSMRSSSRQWLWELERP